MEMTDKELILAEIERLKEYYPSWQLKLAMDDLVSFINSLPEKSVSSDLDFEKPFWYLTDDELSEVVDSRPDKKED